MKKIKLIRNSISKRQTPRKRDIVAGVMEENVPTVNIPRHNFMERIRLKIEY